jgi:ATP-dependent RNA helicase DDX19/DBP5
LSRVDFNDSSCQAICVAPARELARQILDNIRDMGKYTKVTTQLLVPGVLGHNDKIDAQVVVGTPGTLYDFLKRKRLLVSNIKVFVLDEADSMLDQQGLGDTSIRIKK